jgi:hypothetical protein
VDLIHEVEEVEGAVIDVELGVVEGHAAGIGGTRPKLRRTTDIAHAL